MSHPTRLPEHVKVTLEVSSASEQASQSGRAKVIPMEQDTSNRQHLPSVLPNHGPCLHL